MPIVVYQVKDIVTSHVSTLVPNYLVQELLIVEKDRTQVQMGQEGSPTPNSQTQGEDRKKRGEE